MGELVWPPEGSVYLDANSFIYSVERIEPYQTILDTLWQAVSAGQVNVVTSELTLLEVLVKPLKVGDITMATIYRTVLKTTPDIQLLPITQTVLEKAANLRATTNLKTPDAIHAASALLSGRVLFITNDIAFGRINGLNTIILNEVVTANNADSPE